ncbi:polyhydroxyalkanoate synthesis repressor PhaR [Roseomonas terrae]|uniref:Polyhydroxyalkanoate synthesis repressor PhaR n=1 Tax=Neoroseomonas terrae TaxID=424799 RepID=A0ABS5EB75_9PROT|nr:polyhydroxyalkanoate synthesis repressor PhaR [Neoroseomonas terrae]MBR0648276.1 polyhydroxyalkanoate synthesis repressor PhaR [Neoroseomonas terrae]
MAGSAAAASGAQGNETAAAPPVVVKKYANRRLYNTEASTYVTLDDLAKMVRHGRDFVVYDAKSGDDITRSVLTQIIVEEESKGGQNLLPTAFLRQLIGYYGDNLQGLVPRYLEFAMASFGRQQDQMRRTMEHTMVGGFMPFPNIEELGKQNMAMMERAMSLFAPFGRREDAPAEVDALKAEIETLRRQLASLKDAEKSG